MIPSYFSSTYWGPLAYYAQIIKSEEIYWEAKESFTKQSYRNRTYVDGPNGVLMLNIGVNHQSSRLMDQIELDRQEKWAQKHWQALQTSYGASPFFDAIAADLEEFYQKPYHLLWQLNLASFKLVSKWLRLNIELKFTKQWQLEIIDGNDYRQAFSPKAESPLIFPSYPQVFDHKGGFKANLSILDLICNEGPAAYDYLKQL